MAKAEVKLEVTLAPKVYKAVVDLIKPGDWFTIDLATGKRTKVKRGAK